MKLNFLAGMIGTALVLAPIGLAQQQEKAQRPQSGPQYRQESGDGGIRQAIAFERAKDRDDARQARVEAIHPSVDYSNADRQMDDSTTVNRVKDSGPAQGQTVKK
jgi:hypothetical protein